MILDLAIGRLDLEFGRLERSDGEARELTPQECALLGYLAAHPHEDVSREVLLTEVLGYASTVRSRAVDDAMKRLRAKIERVPSRPFHLVGVRGVGYRFVPLETAPSSRRIRLGSNTVDLDRLIVEREGAASLTLTDHEGRLLELLYAREGRPLPTIDLLREVWGIHDAQQRRVVDKLVYRLRAKIEEGGSPRYLRTIRGRGLALVVEARTASSGTPCPPPDGPVVGRDRVIRSVLDHLERSEALVTLHGPAGAGKSTVARAVAQAWPGRACYANLEVFGRSPTTVAASLARAIGVDASPEGPSERLHAALRDGDDLLLVLDHAEGAIDAVAQVLYELFGAAPGARVLVTSRRPTGLALERIVTIDRLEPSAAIGLFVTRAAAAGVPLDAEDERIPQIVEEVDRNPLALDLAAGRLRLLGINGLVARLDRPLDVLRDESDGLRQAIGRTWTALSIADQQRLAALSLLPGTFSADAAEMVTAGLVEGPALDSLQRLVDFAVLRRTADGRLTPFLGISEFVAEVLHDDVEALRRSVGEAHRSYLATLSASTPPFWGPSPRRVAALAHEVPSALAVLEAPDLSVDLRVRILLWLAPVLSMRGLASQGRSLLRRTKGLDDLDDTLRSRFALARMRSLLSTSGSPLDEAAQAAISVSRDAHDPDIEGIALGEWIRHTVDAAPRGQLAPRLARAEALLERVPNALAEAHLRSATGWVAFRRGDLDGAWAELQEAASLARLAQAPWLESRIHYNLAGICRVEGRLAEAEAFLERHRTAYHLAEVPFDSTDPDDMLGLIRLEQGRFTEARTLHEGILKRSRRKGNRSSSATQANRLGTIAGYLGDMDAARRWFELARSGFVALRERAQAEGARYNLGETALQLGRWNEAEAAFQQALEGFQQMGRAVHEGIARGALGRVALARGDHATAEAHLRQALALVESGRAARQSAELQSCLAQALIPTDPEGAVRLARQAVDALHALGQTTTLGCALCRWGLASLAKQDATSAEDALMQARTLMEALPMGSGGELRGLVHTLETSRSEPPA
ncbi:MAG: winged helix-turn-helix domain-containing protein [Myxococcota bacterium]